MFLVIDNFHNVGNITFWTNVKYLDTKGMSGDRFVKELWKEELLAYMTTHQGEMEFEDDAVNVKVSGLKFYTKDDGQDTMKQLREMTGIKENQKQEEVLLSVE